MSSSIFEQVTSAITVKSICRPMGPAIPSGTAIDDLAEMSDQGLDPFASPGRIVDAEGNTIGVAWFEDYFYETGDENRPWLIDEVMRNPEPNCLLSSNTTILDAVELFSDEDRRFFYVIDFNKIIGVLLYEDLFRPIGRIAFLSLALEIEDLALRLCQSPKFRQSCWLSISDNRKQMSLSFFRHRYSRKPHLSRTMRETIPNSEVRDLTEELVERPNHFPDPSGPLSDVLRLVACTQLKDKATMIWKNRLITGRSKTDLLGFFEELKNVRDSCAHPGHDDPILTQDRLADFVSSAMRMRKSLQEAVQDGAKEEPEQLQISPPR
jgi:CBS domain